MSYALLPSPLAAAFVVQDALIWNLRAGGWPFSP